jgi:hypothetical protein
MEQKRTPRMTIPTQLVLRALLANPEQERYGVEIGAATTPKAAGTANASPAESNGAVPAGQVSTPSDIDEPCSSPAPNQNSS